MDHRAEIQKLIQKRETYSKAICFGELVNHPCPELCDTFLRILSEYAKDRIDARKMYQLISKLFNPHPDIIEAFYKWFPQAKSTKNVHDFTETLRPIKKAKIEDDSRIAIIETGPTSNASTSYTSHYSQSPCSNGCCPLEDNTVASGSSSSSQAGNAAEVYGTQKKETAELRDRILYVTEAKTKLMDESQACQHFTELVKEISDNRTDTYAIMKRASNFLQDYPVLTETFNNFLPDGYRIVILSDDHEMGTD